MIRAGYAAGVPDPHPLAAELPRYRAWLRVLAEMQGPSGLQAKFDASDVAQQALLEAVRDLPNYRGQTDAELAGWLRTILAHVLAHHRRAYRDAERRDIGREVPLEGLIASLEHSSSRLADFLADTGTSPSAVAGQREQVENLLAVLDRLPEEYRQVILLRNLSGLSHEEVARQMNRTPGAVRMLWMRALGRLREELRSET
jgi:RNA polymerase sigma-70 factor (ECF subfamily)